MHKFVTIRSLFSLLLGCYRTLPTSLLQFSADYALAGGDGGVDRTWYLQTYPDIATTRLDPVEHYLRFGWREGRDPQPDFSTCGYLEANEEVKGNPLVHYLRHGGTKVPSPEWQFAADYALASGDGGVDRTWYLQTYPDIATARLDPVEHYLRSGWREGRDPRSDFSTCGYLAANEKVEGNPLVHYLLSPREARLAAGRGESEYQYGHVANIKGRLKALSGKIGRTIRAEEWWDYKLVPIFSVFYATAYIQHVSVASVWSAAVALLLAIAPCAAYVSLINDLTDREDDRCAGKSNRMEGRPVWQVAALLAAPLCVAVFFCILWSDDILLVAAYLGAWVVFSLYSISPFRLKNRGGLGVIADACGSHVFPKLTAALLAYRAAGNPIDRVWIAAVIIWALGYGLRGILLHQLCDFEADHKAGVQTFVVKHSRGSAVRLARLALLIVLIGLAMLVWQIESVWPVVFMLIYAAFAILNSRVWNVAIVIAEPVGPYSIFGQEYYILLFPLALLLSLALQYPADWAVAIAHLIIFRQPAVFFITETRLLLRDLAQGKRRSV